MPYYARPLREYAPEHGYDLYENNLLVAVIRPRNPFGGGNFASLVKRIVQGLNRIEQENDNGR